MKIEQLTTLVAAGELAVQMWRAEKALDMAKGAYLGRIHEFENAFGEVPRTGPVDDPDRVALNAYTKQRYDLLQDARRDVYRARRKLRLACQTVARLEASAKGGAR